MKKFLIIWVGELLYGNIRKVIGTGAGRGAALLIIVGGFCMCILAPFIYRSGKIRALKAAEVALWNISE